MRHELHVCPGPIAFGVWRLAFGVWRLAFGVWRLAFGVRRSAFGVWRLAFGGFPDLNYLEEYHCPVERLLDDLAVQILPPCSPAGFYAPGWRSEPD